MFSYDSYYGNAGDRVTYYNSEHNRSLCVAYRTDIIEDLDAMRSESDLPKPVEESIAC